MLSSPLLVLSVFVGVLVIAQPPGSSSGTITALHPAVRDLETCRTRTNETLKMVDCYQVATQQMPTNFSWWASLALLQLRAEMPQAAMESMNYSANVWLRHVQPQMQEAQQQGTFSPKDGRIRWVDALRFVYDDASEGEGARRHEAVEMGLCLAKKFELEHMISDAHSIYYEFLLQTGQGEREVMEFHRRTGNIIAMILTGRQNHSSVLFRLSEGIQPIVDGLTEHLMSAPTPLADNAPIRRMCGIEFDQNDVIKSRTIVDAITECIVEKWGNLTKVLQTEPEGQSLIAVTEMRETPIHRLASLGATRILKDVVPFFAGKQIPGDRFGRTSLHSAAAAGHEDTVRFVIGEGGDVNTEDKGKISARHLGCSSPKFRKQFESLLKKEVREFKNVDDICGEHARRRLEDEEAEITDDTGNDGDWNPKQKVPGYLHCDFDVRDAGKISQSDLMVAYTHSNHPVVIRNAFYLTDGPSKLWGKKLFNRTFGKVAMRRERYPKGEKFGLGKAEMTTVADFIKTLNVDDGMSANVHIDHVGHPLNGIAGEWVPPAFTEKRRIDEVDLYDPKLTVPMVVLSKKGAQSHHHIRVQNTYHTVVYGHQEWAVLPPRSAKTIRKPLEESPQALRCEVYTGDVIILPDMWSASWTAKSNGVSVERHVYKKTRAEPKRNREAEESKEGDEPNYDL